MAYTNTGLVEYCKRGLKEGWRYLWGTYGQKANQALLTSNIRQYPENEKWRTYAMGAIGTTRFSDCYGLVKGYVWGGTAATDPKYNANGFTDRNTKSAYDAAKEKGKITNMPDVPGLVLYMPGHVGVYIGGGQFIECAGGGKGMVQGGISGGKVVKGSKFTDWFKNSWLDYGASAGGSIFQTEIKPNSRVRINPGAVFGGNDQNVKGKPVPIGDCGKVFTVSVMAYQNGQNEALLSPLWRYVAVKDLTLA